MDALAVGIEHRKVNFIVDADIRSFFDTVDQQWLTRFVEHRIGDPRIIRLIQKWLKAGVLEEGTVRVGDQGTAQGAVISPLLANVYLHYALDLWAERYRRREATGDMIIVRYADDFIVGFEYEDEARHFLEALRERLREFALSLHPEKTRLIEFGRNAEDNRRRRGLGKPETFNFLGFTFICGRSRRGEFQIRRKSRRDRMRAKLKAVKRELRRRMHQPVLEQGKWLRQVVTGYFNDHAVPTNSRALSAFRFFVIELWRRTLRRRSQTDGMRWETISRLACDCLPRPNIRHPWPRARSPSLTRGGSRMRESRTYGSVRGALSNERPYRDRCARKTMLEQLRTPLQRRPGADWAHPAASATCVIRVKLPSPQLKPICNDRCSGSPWRR
ncbi:group II intron reverse transcriptase/maturase [Bradyrhizobium sp. LM2.7]